MPCFLVIIVWGFSGDIVEYGMKHYNHQAGLGDVYSTSLFYVQIHSVKENICNILKRIFTLWEFTISRHKRHCCEIARLLELHPTKDIIEVLSHA